jgi:hypothetical protein
LRRQPAQISREDTHGGFDADVSSHGRPQLLIEDQRPNGAAKAVAARAAVARVDAVRDPAKSFMPSAMRSAVASAREH